MIRPFAIAALLTVPLLAAETPAERPADPLRPKPSPGGSATPEAAGERLPDLLRFTNGNQIDGQFSGMDSSGVVTWTRPDVAAPMAFQREKLRQIVLRDARPISALGDPCHVTLVNGDRIPGKVVAADDENFTLESTSAGTLILPRDSVSVIAPNPFGGRLIYAGPFDAKGWKIVQSDAPAFEADPFAGNRAVPPKNDGGDKPTWVHSGASWFSRGGADAITLDAGMPDRALIRFKLGWRSRPSIAVAFHADLDQPEPAEKKEGGEAAPPRPNFSGSQNLARLFGSGYVINFQGGYVRLQRTGFDDEGNPQTEPVRVGNTSIRLPDTGEAVFEIRCDRQEGTITVHINHEFAVQWNTTEEGDREVSKGEPRHVVYQAPGGGLGFQAPGNAGPIRISDVVVAEWNGMTDSARSMESDSRDITLLANGTDRFSGRLLSIRDGLAEIEASYGPLKIPLEDVGEIHFARGGRRKAGDAPASEITVHLKPVGRISGIPLSATTGRIRLETRLAGKVDLDLAPAVVLEFQSGGGFLDDWDDAP